MLQSKEREGADPATTHRGILTTKSIRQNAFVLHRNAIIWGSFDFAQDDSFFVGRLTPAV
jgi:hypothetical protein